MAYNLYTESMLIAQEALSIANDDFKEAQDFLHELCDSSEIVIYTGKAIQFCASVNTSEGESWLEDMGGISKNGDTFGDIACRLAFATLYCAAQERLNELEKGQ